MIIGLHKFSWNYFLIYIFSPFFFRWSQVFIRWAWLYTRNQKFTCFSYVFTLSEHFIATKRIVSEWTACFSWSDFSSFRVFGNWRNLIRWIFIGECWPLHTTAVARIRSIELNWFGSISCSVHRSHMLRLRSRQLRIVVSVFAYNRAMLLDKSIDIFCCVSHPCLHIKIDLCSHACESHLLALIRFIDSSAKRCMLMMRWIRVGFGKFHQIEWAVRLCLFINHPSNRQSLFIFE